MQSLSLNDIATKRGSGTENTSRGTVFSHDKTVKKHELDIRQYDLSSSTVHHTPLSHISASATVLRTLDEMIVSSSFIKQSLKHELLKVSEDRLRIFQAAKCGSYGYAQDYLKVPVNCPLDWFGKMSQNLRNQDPDYHCSDIIFPPLLENILNPSKASAGLCLDCTTFDSVLFTWLEMHDDSDFEKIYMKGMQDSQNMYARILGSRAVISPEEQMAVAKRTLKFYYLKEPCKMFKSTALELGANWQGLFGQTTIVKRGNLLLYVVIR